MNFCGNSSNTVALTFDDGPNTEMTPFILDELKELGIQATFFLSTNARGNANREQCSLVERIVNEGHEIQVHTFSHHTLTSESLEFLDNDLDKNLGWVAGCAGANRSQMTLDHFRPPFGEHEAEHTTLLNEKGYILSMWNLDTNDWRNGNIDAMLSELETQYGAETQKSSIVLMHDHVYSEGNLKRIVDFFPSGTNFVTSSSCYEQCGENVCDDVGNANATPIRR